MPNNKAAIISGMLARPCELAPLPTPGALEPSVESRAGSQRKRFDPRSLDEKRIGHDCKAPYSFLVTQGHVLAICESAVSAVSGETAPIDRTALPDLDPDDLIAFAHTL